MLAEIDFEQIARQAHAAWCGKMIREGWTPGEEYSPMGRTHDALVPFEQLSRRDALAALRAAEFDGADLLASIIDYRRGPDRDFTLEEMRVGLAVICVDDDPPIRGEVTDWVSDERGQLMTIIVRWTDGAVSEHPAFAGELARADE